MSEKWIREEVEAFLRSRGCLEPAGHPDLDGWVDAASRCVERAKPRACDTCGGRAVLKDEGDECPWCAQDILVYYAKRDVAIRALEWVSERKEMYFDTLDALARLRAGKDVDWEG